MTDPTPFSSAPGQCSQTRSGAPPDALAFSTLRRADPPHHATAPYKSGCTASLFFFLF